MTRDPIAQVTIARMREPLESALMAPFVARFVERDGLASTVRVHSL